jgi:hypothetical protein
MATRFWAMHLLFLIGLLAVATPMATASDTQWNIQFTLAKGTLDGSPYDIGETLGVRPDATDNYDSMLDARKPPQPLGPYVYLYWNRPSWDGWPQYKADWRSEITLGDCKTWQDLIARSNLTGPKTLSWTFAVGGSAWTVPPCYTVTLYDEGTTPNPTGGTPIDMVASSTILFNYSAGELHYFHVNVCRGTPACEP